MFSILWKTTLTFWVKFNLLSANAVNLGNPKILSTGNGLTLSQTSPGFYESTVQVFRKHFGSPGFYESTVQVFRKHLGKHSVF